MSSCWKLLSEVLMSVELMIIRLMILRLGLLLASLHPTKVRLLPSCTSMRIMVRERLFTPVGQIVEHFKNQVHDRSVKTGGKQCIVTLDGYVLPLSIRSGLPYLGYAITDSRMSWIRLPARCS